MMDNKFQTFLSMVLGKFRANMSDEDRAKERKLHRAINKHKQKVKSLAADADKALAAQRKQKTFQELQTVMEIVQKEMRDSAAICTAVREGLGGVAKNETSTDSDGGAA